MFRQLGIIGCGLIGSSIVRAARAANIATRIVVLETDPDALAEVVSLKLADEADDRPDRIIPECDLVIVCVPVGNTRSALQMIGPHLAPGCILSDVGSVKKAVIDMAQDLVPPSVHFIPAHPISGREKSGPAAGFAELFRDRWCLLTPLPNTDPAALARLMAFWESLGSTVECMDPQRHDLTLGITSHLPHLIAYTIVGTATELEDHLKQDVIRFSAGGFRDFTRIAASNPIMWRDVFLHNRDAVLEILQRFTEDLTALQKAIRQGDGQTLEDWFTRTRAIRQAIIDQGQAVDPPTQPAGQTPPVAAQ